MELKLETVKKMYAWMCVLIVPFMELKLLHILITGTERVGLNRTFYGIETRDRQHTEVALCRLNRTFYGIETVLYLHQQRAKDGLNRTFYGIETRVRLVGFEGSKTS